MTVKVAVVEVPATVTATSWSPLGSENINMSVVNSPDALVEGLGDGSTEMLPIPEALMASCPTVE